MNRLLNWTLAGLLLIGVTTSIGSCKVSGKNQLSVKYVSNSELFQAFEYTKELNMQLETVQLQRQYHLDSIRLMIEKQSSDKSETYNRLIGEYREKEQYFNRSNAEITKDYDERIWKQLNQYIEDFRIQQDIDILLGANGSGAIMAIDSSMDITSEALEYINIRYKGFE